MVPAARLVVRPANHLRPVSGTLTTTSRNSRLFALHQRYRECHRVGTKELSGQRSALSIESTKEASSLIEHPKSAMALKLGGAPRPTGKVCENQKIVF